MDSTLPVKLLLANYNVITDSKAIASALKNYFSQISSKLAEIPQVDINPPDVLGPSQANSFMLFPASAVDIEEVITSLICVCKCVREW